MAEPFTQLRNAPHGDQHLVAPEPLGCAQGAVGVILLEKAAVHPRLVIGCAGQVIAKRLVDLPLDASGENPSLRRASRTSASPFLRSPRRQQRAQQGEHALGRQRRPLVGIRFDLRRARPFLERQQPPALRRSVTVLGQLPLALMNATKREVGAGSSLRRITHSSSFLATVIGEMFFADLARLGLLAGPGRAFRRRALSAETSHRGCGHDGGRGGRRAGGLTERPTHVAVVDSCEVSLFDPESKLA